MTEVWKPVPGFGDYMVSSLGQVRHRRIGATILKGSFDKDGYHRVGLGRRTVRTHVLVAKAFHGNRPDNCECAHLDGNKSNNIASNLAWLTHAENNDQKREHGTHQARDKHPRARLTSEEVESIRASTLSSRAVAKRFNVNQSHVVRIRNGVRWAEGIAQGEVGSQDSQQ